MKKFIITEDERERILGLHKTLFLENNPGITTTTTQAPATSTMGLVGNIRQDIRQAKQDIRQDARQVRQDARQAERQANQMARQDARQVRQDARQDARQERQDTRDANQAERQAQRELARTQRQAEREANQQQRQANRQARIQARDLAKAQGELADYQRVLAILQQADKNRKATNPQDNSYAALLQTYQTAIANLSSDIQAMSGQK